MIPSQLVIGNFGLSVDQAKTQMAIWSILAAPLFISADLRTLDSQFKKILLNKEVIAVNQDEFGRMGRRIFNVGVFPPFRFSPGTKLTDV